MATKSSMRVDCPACGESFDADFWTVVRGDRDTGLKEAIISGEFDLLMCPRCRGVFSREETFIYLDPDMELLAFVLPSAYAGESGKWTAKMREDYEAVRPTLFQGKPVDYEPRCLFGLGELTALLLRDRDAEEETDVMEFMAREADLRLAPLLPSRARERDILFSAPYAGPEPTRGAAIEALKKIEAANDALARVRRTRELFEKLSGDALPFLKKQP
ncbi:MAG TPA: CpXC domain-containing protein [Elusimicrobiales bacterium]|nr:CpXC domain-containing protein [Elusimicrobiales bacterium]